MIGAPGSPPGGKLALPCVDDHPQTERDHHAALPGLGRQLRHRRRLSRVNLGNPDRPVGGLSVPRPAGVEIRPLARDDFADALGLARELYGLPDADPAPHRRPYLELVNDVDALSYLATADGRAAGLIVFRFRRRLNHATFEGWISDLPVSDAFRRRGIGRALVASVIAEWRLRGSHRIQLEVGADRTAARALYAGLGFVEQGKYFEIGPISKRGIEPSAGVVVRPIED